MIYLSIQKKEFQFIAPEFLRQEIANKYVRLSKISGLEIKQIQEAEYYVCREITFISKEQINSKFWNEAYELVKNIDENDVHYIAYARQFKCKLWSGDKKLAEGLLKKGFNNIISTNELFELRQDRLNK